MELENKEITDKLETIFMQNLSRGKERLAKGNNQFVHYTSAENALNIIKSESLWMRSPTCMNDYMEISHGYQMLLAFFQNTHSKKIFVEAIESIEQGMADAILNGFDELWEKIRHDAFIASVSEHPSSESKYGRLSMWRAYGSQGGKAGIVLNNPPKPSMKLGVILSPAAYFTQEQLNEELLSVASSVAKNTDYLKTLQRETIIGTVIVSLVILAVCLKHPGFQEEKEWRLIYLPTLIPDHGWITRTIETIIGVPQLVYKLPLKNNDELDITGLSIPEIIEIIIIGPTQYPMAMHDAFVEKLAEYGIKNAEERIVVSDIPLRT